MVLDIDMGEDDHGNPHDGWASLTENDLDDLPDTFHYSTRRGGDHLWFEPVDGRRLGPTKGHITPDGLVLDSVDRRAGDSYAIFWGNEIPAARDEFAPAPEWLLTEAPEQTFSPFGGSVDEWLAKCEPGEPESYVREIVDSIPATDFGHDALIRLQATLVGLGADHRAGIPWALDRLRSEWLRGEYNTPEYRADYAFGLAGAIEKYGNFSVPLLPVSAPAPEPQVEAPALDPLDCALAVKGDDFFAAWHGLPHAMTPESLVERVRWLRDMAIERGTSREAAVAAAFGSAARKHDMCPLESVADVEALPAGGMEERLFLPEPLVDTDPLERSESPKRRTIHLLTPAEEAQLEDITWWGEEFMAMMRKVNRVMSDEYYRLHRWMILSLVFASRATIMRSNGSELPLNLYGAIVGESSTGKSESLAPVLGIAEAYYELSMEDSPDIGGDATAAGLTEALIMRDGKTSFFHADEADAVIRNWNNQQGEFRGMKQKITDFYGGRVPPIQRASKKDISGIKAKAYLCVHLTGIKKEIADAIEPRDWESGFLNRFLWAIGEEKYVAPEDDMFDAISSDEDVRTSNVSDWYRQWASKFRGIAESRLGTYGDPRLISFDQDVRERHARFVGDLNRIAANHRHPERLKPTVNRWKATVMKCAALVAISEARTNVQMSDFLVALEQMEEWVENSLTMIALTDETFRAREVSAVAQLIEEAPGKSMAGEDVHIAYRDKSDWRYVDGLLKELEMQGRVERLPMAKDRAMYRLIEGRN